MSFLSKSKEIVSHYPMVCIYSHNDKFTVSVDTDTEDLNRQPKNIKIATQDIQELTINVQGFEELEPADGKYFTCSGEVLLINTKDNGEVVKYKLAEPKIKVNSVKKGHLPPAEEIKKLVRNAWLDAYSDACQSINNPSYLQPESNFEKFKNSKIGKFLAIVFGVFIVLYLILTAIGYMKSQSTPVDQTQVIAEQIANDPQAAQQLLNQLEQQNMADQQANSAAYQEMNGTSEQVTEQERREELSSFGLDPGISD